MLFSPNDNHWKRWYNGVITTCWLNCMSAFMCEIRTCGGRLDCPGHVFGVWRAEVNLGGITRYLPSCFLSLTWNSPVWLASKPRGLWHWDYTCKPHVFKKKMWTDWGLHACSASTSLSHPQSLTFFVCLRMSPFRKVFLWERGWWVKKQATVKTPSYGTKVTFLQWPKPSRDWALASLASFFQPVHQNSTRQGWLILNSGKLSMSPFAHQDWQELLNVMTICTTPRVQPL